ncbi:hypothetical protein SERLADRAFT_408878 [Serpula lacrymans var. lacrymans S7.9]|uniref:Transcription factor domain-containing protein n=1 Tax=Serpula lacrymans var. lacrymans (strain S7.9) TaxID=578457 RepID=F8P0C4_SERL9|nr:uncharacterized protein SERLADRAFT_408878 [Serpula lacrymans var. lacrymans S7.9]EGO23497.1 hypothetical protein SERLADRAFT_408878 [Serpula lacrymans var. lacrymans S7.9]
MPPGEGSRFVGIAEDYLRRKMTKMEERMHSLEDALAIIQTNSSNQPHPLLINAPSPDDTETETEEQSKTLNEFNRYGLIDALGSLHLDSEEHGGAVRSAVRFFGPSGGSERAKEIVTEASTPPSFPQDFDASYLPEEIKIFYKSFPFTPSGIPIAPVQSMIESFLPEIGRATLLCETFTEHLTWMFHIVSRRHIINELIPAVYKHLGNPSEPLEYGPHDLALLFIVLAIGALVDFTLPPYNAEGQLYYRLARSIVTVKTLHLMSIYNGTSGLESNLENSYSLLNFAGQIALQIGSHKDPSLWGFESREAYDRRMSFWNLFAGTLWQNLMKLLFKKEKFLWAVSWRMEPQIHCGMLGASRASYSSGEATELSVYPGTRPENLMSQNHKTRFTSSRRPKRCKLGCDLTIGSSRIFFAQAMTDYPSDPMRSPLGQSFLAAYQSACVVLDSTRVQYSLQPILCARVWRIWSYAFSAAVIIGTVAMRRLGLKLDPPPFDKLEQACSLFKAAAETSSRAKKALPILLRLRQKALLSSQDVVMHPAAFTTGQSHTADHDERDDELAIFGGRTMLVTPKPSTDYIPFSPTEVSVDYSTGPMNEIPIQGQAHELQQSSGCIPVPSSSYHGHPTSERVVGLPLEWENLYPEIPGPSHSYDTGAVYNQAIPGIDHRQRGIMLEDRWSSFMHHCTVPSNHAPPS